MAKKGMKRANVTHTKQRNEAASVPEIQGKAKHGNKTANPIIEGVNSAPLKVYHTKPFSTQEKPIPDAYAAIDSDLARDNVENDLTAADLQDL